MLNLYNSLTRQKEPLTPLIPGWVRMYVCGMTVYDYCHLGHARVMVVFDVLYRYLQVLGYDVTYVRNITDIDDKIIQRAAENGESLETLTARTIAAMHADAAALGVLSPDHEPRATAYIAAMQRLIQRLLEQGHAYVADNGDVYYQVSRFAPYGKLSGKLPADLRAGARVEINTQKRDPIDFVLWKAAKPGEPHWDSPWSCGRPGWHIECSAMAGDLLGPSFDLHGGGMDLQFPHHENEIAQSEAAHEGACLAKHWMHVGFVRVNQEKMSKSLGNFFLIRDILARYPAEAVRYLLLGSHYRGPLDYSDAELTHAKTSLTRLYLALADLPSAPEQVDASQERFHAALQDDLNTPMACAVLHDLARQINVLRQKSGLAAAAGLGATLKALGGMLGLLQADPQTYLQTAAPAAIEGLSNAAIEDLLAQRQAARCARDFAKADQIRLELQAQGVILEDGAAGTRWRRE